MTAHLTLHRARILETLSESEVERLAALGEERTLLSGEALFRDPSGTPSVLYIVLEGRLRSSLFERDQQTELARHNPGDHFASAVLIDGQLCPTLVSALTQSRVFVLCQAGSLALLARIERGRAYVPNITPSPDPREPQLVVFSSPPSSAAGDLMHIRSMSIAVAGVAHEINTPLGVIESAASFVSEQLSSENLGLFAEDRAAAEMLTDVGEACRLIQKNVAHAARLVQSFKKLSVGQLAEPREQIDLVRVIHEVLNAFRAKTLSALPPGPSYRVPRGTSSAQHRLILASSRLDICVMCELAESDRVWDGFPGLFSRVLLNLLTNIDRYAYPGDAPGRVEITLLRKDVLPAVPGFELSVRDFGQGIAPDDLPRIFDPFFTTGRDRGGTGLGLVMVHNLVTQGFNGSVGVSSVVGEGTVFELNFPERAPDHAPLVEPDASRGPQNFS